MVKLISVAALCLGMVAGAPAAATELSPMQAQPRMMRTVWWTVRIVPAPVPCSTDSDCERKNGGPVVLNSRPVYRT